MKKIPKLYKNENNNMKFHNTTSYHITNNTGITNKEEIINKIFNGTRHPYNIRVFIKTNNTSYETYFIAKKNNILTTIDNKNIPLEEIQYIEIKN